MTRSTPQPAPRTPFGRRRKTIVIVLTLASVALGAATGAAKPPTAPPGASPSAGASESSESVERFTAGWGASLAQFVDTEGLVTTAGLALEHGRLDSLAATLEAIRPGELPGDDHRIAFWINAYNFLVVRSVASAYPVRSPREIPGFFDRRRHRVGGRTLTLDRIEKNELLGRHRDERLHFALSCAARSCPPLARGPFRAETLDARLEEATRAAVRDPQFVARAPETGDVVLSRIFDWYRNDFERAAGSLEAWLTARATFPVPGGTRLRFRDYDWTLNDASLRPDGGSGGHPALRITPSTLLLPGETELQFFQNIYTQKAFFDGDGERREQDGRSTYYTGTIAFHSGWKPRWNPGLDLTLKAVRDETFRPEGPDGAAGTRDDHPFFRDDTRVALTSIRPNVQFQPFAHRPRLSVETGLEIPLGSNLDGFEDGRRQWPFLDSGKPAWWNEVFWDLPLGPRLLAFFRTGAILRFDSDDAQLTTPLTSIVNVYPRSGWTIYVVGEVAPDWVGDSSGNYFAQLGAGAKALVTPEVELEVLYTTFPFGRGAGAGRTFNLGLRVLR